ncbi:MAG: ABC transporter permease, partial [Candidatus Faecivicinus sp.]|nr:ABC transporter permease [Candidatus Faecivicinus sp.]
MVKRRSLSRGLKGTYLALVLAFLYLPIAVMIALSFNESVSRAEWTGFTFQWYAKLLERQDIIQALNLTVRVAFEATVAATIIGTFGAIGIHAMKKGWAG